MGTSRAAELARHSASVVRKVCTQKNTNFYPACHLRELHQISASVLKAGPASVGDTRVLLRIMSPSVAGPDLLARESELYCSIAILISRGRFGPILARRLVGSSQAPRGKPRWGCPSPHPGA